MRTDVTVADQEVLALVLTDSALNLSHTVLTIRQAIRRSKTGQTREVKDFLQPESVDSHVTRGVNSRRRKCDAFFLSCLDAVHTEQLKAGKLKYNKCLPLHTHAHFWYYW